MEQRSSALVAILFCATCSASNIHFGGSGNAGDDNAVAICSAAPPFLMIDSLLGSPQPGGTWITTGGTAHSSAFIPGVDPAGTYCYVVGNDTACLTVTIITAPNAGTDASVTLCSNGPIMPLFPYLGGNPDTGGFWIQCGPFQWCYVVPGTTPCPNDTAVVTVWVNQAPDAGLNAIIGICINGDPVLLFDSIPGTPQLGGTWSDPGGIQMNGIFVPGVTTPGVFHYMVPGVAPCPNASSWLTVNVLPSTDPGCISLGIDHNTKPVAGLRPNPSTGSLTITGMSDGTSNVRVRDELGRDLWQGSTTVAAGSAQITLPNTLANGRYVLVITGAAVTEQRLPFLLMR